MKEKANRHATGQTGEALVAAGLARRGYTVALPTGNAKDIDILAYRPREMRAIQVKAISRGGFQYTLNKFLRITIEGEAGDERQLVHGSREDLDRDIDIVIVFLGDEAGKDRFYCAKLGDFVDFAGKSHRAYIEPHCGRRPGKNKKSMHAALTENQIIKSGKFNDFNQFYPAG